MTEDPRRNRIWRGGGFQSFGLEHTEELHKKGHDPDDHDGVVTHLEPDILECEVKWSLGGITRNKASGGDGFIYIKD